MYTRTSPFFAHIKERHLLTKPSSSKKTYHIVLSTRGLPFPFKVGDSIGILPTNDPNEVEALLKILKANPEEKVFDSRAKEEVSFRQFLQYRANLSQVNRSLLSRLAELAHNKEVLEPLLAPEGKSALSSYLQQHTLGEILAENPSELAPQELVKLAMPLLPRFYSIANSPKAHPEEIHLTVGYVEYEQNGRLRRGVGSHFLCNLAEVAKTDLPIYLQPSNSFSLPSNPSLPIIMVGPGTGVAPYRAFLQERLCHQHEGKNWLFFGERNRETDFYYEEFFTDLEKKNFLRMSLAFSRDGAEKEYVQHRMYQERKNLWDWLQEGAHFYVCGDAKEMAKDVEATLYKIAQEEGKFSEEEARLFIKRLRQEKRYLADVY